MRYFRFFFFLGLLLPFSGFSQQKAADSLETLLKEKMHDTLRIDRLLELSKVYTNIDMEKAATSATQAITLSLKIGDNHRVGLAYILYGNTFLLGSGDANRAQVEYRKALALAEKGNDLKVKGGALNCLGSCNKVLGNIDSALYYYESALVIREAIRDSVGMGGTMSNLGMIYNVKGDMKHSLDWFYKSLAIKEREKSPASLAPTYVNIAIAQLDLGQPEKAKESFQKAYDIYAALDNKRWMATCLNGIGIANFDLKKYDEALAKYRESEKIRLERADTADLAETYTNIGNVYHTVGDHKEALVYYRKAIAMSVYSDLTHYVQFLCNIAVGFGHVGKIDSALVMADSANALAASAGQPILRINVLGAYIDIYKLDGQYAKALDFFEQRVTLNDSIFKSESVKQINELDAKYQKAQDEKAIGLLQKDKQLLQKDQEKKEWMIYAFSGGTVLLLLVVGLIYRSNRQRRRTNLRLEEQNKIIAEKNKDITDSITYASRIQQSVMPDERLLKESVTDYFVLNRPRDIVSGDFFWLAKKEERLYVAVADCTGHGVPGALVSVIGITMLNKVIELPGKPSPSEMLELLHDLVLHALNKDAVARDTQDGMDIALLCIDKVAGKAFFSGAGRPLYVVRNGQMELMKGDRYSIAGAKEAGDAPYAQHEIALGGDVKFYLSSDGFADQFGEQTGKKYLTKRFQELLVAVSALPMRDQKDRVEKEFDGWKGRLEQVDDILVLGVKP